MPVVKSEYSCPRCKKLGQTNQIIANAGQLQCSVNGEHTWLDTMEFFSEGPKMEFKVEQPKALPQDNYEPITVSVPIGLKGALEAKYGDKAMATLGSVLLQMIEGEGMHIVELDLERIAAKLGAQPRNSSELYGMIYAKCEEIADLKLIADNASKDLKAYENMSPGRVIVDLGDQFANAQDKARGAELPVKLWIERALRNGLENNWF